MGLMERKIGANLVLLQTFISLQLSNNDPLKLQIVDFETSIKEAFEICEHHFSEKQIEKQMSLDSVCSLKSDQRVLEQLTLSIVNLTYSISE